MRELLPDWLLSPAYAFRRAFLPRRGRFRLVRDEDGRFRLGASSRRLPHGRVLLRPIGWPEWETLEIAGVIRNGGAPVRWESWLERPSSAGPLELEIPYALQELGIRLVPAAEGARELLLELDELGAVGRLRASLAEVTPGSLGELRRAMSETGASYGRLDRAAWTLWEGVDGTSYARWLRTFDVPPPAALDRVRTRVAGSGLRLSIVAAPRRDEPDLAGQLPGQVEIVRSLREASGDILLPLDSGAHLAPHALATVLFLFLQHQEAALLHADDDRMDSGRRTRPDFKPVLGPELLRSRNPLRGLVAVRRSVAPDLPAGPLDEAGRYAWLLGCVARIPPGRIRRVPLVLATLDADRAVDELRERAVLASHLEQLEVEADVAPGLAPGLHHVRYRLPDPTPRVMIVVPTRNGRALVETCVRSVRRLTRYPRYEIQLVDNGSDDPEALAAFEAMARAGDVVLQRDAGPFNFSALNNAAVARSDADLVCLLNNDIEVLHSEWLEEMVSVALQPGVGAVGAKLLYPDGRIQHGGVLVGLNHAADHVYAGAPGDAPGYTQQLLIRREVSAVTAACLVVRRALYREVEGLDEEAFPVAFNDVDFCLKLRERGLRNVWTPHARLVHHESASRGRRRSAEQEARANRELAALRARWAAALVEDPYHSPNLSLKSKVPRLAWPPRERRPWATI